MKVSKTIVLAALVGLLSRESVQAIKLTQKVEPGAIAYQPPKMSLAEVEAEAAPAKAPAAPAKAAAAPAPAAAPATKPVEPVAAKPGQTQAEAAAEATKKLSAKDEEKLTKKVV